MRVLQVPVAGLVMCGWLAGCTNPTATTQPATPAVSDVPFPTATAPAPTPPAAQQIGLAHEAITTGMAEEQVRRQLGEPTLIQGNQWAYVVNDAMGQGLATITFVQGKVTGVHSSWKPGWEYLAAAQEHVARGASEAQVAAELGEADLRRAGVWWTYAPPEVAPSRVELFFQEDSLCWGSAYMLARLGVIKPGADMHLNTAGVRALLGEPLATDAGAQWTYLARDAGHEVRATVYFRGEAVSAVTVSATPQHEYAD
jgi:hypothetical protein